MNRILLATLLGTAACTMADAQPGPDRAPNYENDQPPAPDGYDDSYDSSDVRRPEHPSTRWVTPRPYARADQVDEGTPDDAAHQADRAYTAELNRRAWPGRNAAPPAEGYGAAGARYRQQRADYARELDDYRAEQARYAQRIARWHAHANACEAGYYDACQGPE